MGDTRAAYEYEYQRIRSEQRSRRLGCASGDPRHSVERAVANAAYHSYVDFCREPTGWAKSEREDRFTRLALDYRLRRLAALKKRVLSRKALQ